jgi:hypothetical protein
VVDQSTQRAQIHRIQALPLLLTFRRFQIHRHLAESPVVDNGFTLSLRWNALTSFTPMVLSSARIVAR